MNHSAANFLRQGGRFAAHWLQARLQECLHCTECQSGIAPFAAYCPKCGQANPAKVSISAAVYLTLGFAFLTAALLLLF
jgi:hypothetical protein